MQSKLLLLIQRNRIFKFQYIMHQVKRKNTIKILLAGNFRIKEEEIELTMLMAV